MTAAVILVTMILLGRCKSIILPRVVQLHSFSATSTAKVSSSTYCPYRSTYHTSSRLLRTSLSSLLPRSHRQQASFISLSHLRMEASGSMQGSTAPGGARSSQQAAGIDPLRPRPLLRRCITEAPPEPGVYVMESVDRRKLYIGKSIKLSSRVPSYFDISSSSGGGGNGRREEGKKAAEAAGTVLPGSNLSRRIAVMTTLVERIDYIVTASGSEALMLEADMIRQHQPPFNVLLKDDKRNYPYVCFTWSEPYPRLLITRDRPRPGGRGDCVKQDHYYGPFVDAGQLKATVALVRRVLPLRERHRPLYKDKPCLNYDIGLCPGPCQRLISEEDYAETVRLAEKVFRGQGGELLERLRGRMEAASKAEEFETAGEIKEKMALVRGGLLGSALHFSLSAAGVGAEPAAGEGRKREEGGGFRRDVVAVGLADDLACFQVFRVRDGRLTGRLGFTYRVGQEEGLRTRGEVLQACLERYWGDTLASASCSSSGSSPLAPTGAAGALLGGKRSLSGRSASPSSSSSSSSSVLETTGVGDPIGKREGEDYFVDIPDEIVTADALPEGGADLLLELLSEARDARAAAAAATAAASTGAVDSGKGLSSPINAGNGSDDRRHHGKKESKVAKGTEGTRTPVTDRSSKQKKKVVPINIVHGGAEKVGERHHLCVMVSKNAELEAKRLLRGSEDALQGLSQLAEMLGLSLPPSRIEGFDVSHTAGGQAVASIVCFEGGKANPAGHRRYRIKATEVRKGHSDDYASLREVVARRFSPRRDRRGTVATAPTTGDPADAIDAGDDVHAAVICTSPLPDLVVIDGGKGQLAAALEGAAIAAAAWRQLSLGRDSASGNDNAVNGASGHIQLPSEINDDEPYSALSLARSRSRNDLLADSVVNEAGVTAKITAGVDDDEDDPDSVLLAPTPADSPLQSVLSNRQNGGIVSNKIAGGYSGTTTTTLTNTNTNNKQGTSATPMMVDVGGQRKVPFVSLAKKEEEVYAPRASLPLAAAVEAGPSSPGVMLLRQVRDEAHRFAIAYHRKVRSRDMFLQSSTTGNADSAIVGVPSAQGGFEKIAGLSAKTRQALVNTFGSVGQAKVAGEAELRRIPGVGPIIAKRILE